jgi:N-acetylneuraminate synthase
MGIKIGSITLERRGKPCFIADIAANHDGDLSRAYKLIELAKEAGADIAKFQNFHANRIVSRNGFDTMEKQTHQSAWKKSVYEVYEDASLNEEWNEKLKRKCDEVGIEYMTSPYDFESIDQVDSLLNAYKIGSGDITWTNALEYMAQKGKPILLATGASDMTDVDRAVQAVLKYNQQIVLMQCNTNYTASVQNYKHINLNVLKEYEKRYPSFVLGLSDHTHGYATVLGAIALGAVVIEKHFTDDNDRDGPDHRFSMTPASWREMVKESNYLWSALGDGVKRVEDNEQQTVIVQRRALYTVKDLVAGSVLQQADIFPLRPCKNGGILPYEVDKFVGRKLKRNISKDTCLTWEDFE